MESKGLVVARAEMMGLKVELVGLVSSGWKSWRANSFYEKTTFIHR